MTDLRGPTGTPADADTPVVDPFDARIARRAPDLLKEFNDAGVLAAADVHVAVRLGAIVGETDESVLLAAALAVRGPRMGHVYVDLATIATTAAVETEQPVDLAALPWPAAGPWLEAVRASPAVAVGDEPVPGDRDDPRPLRLVEGRLYLDRYWREERRIAEDLAAFAAEPVAGVDGGVLAEGLTRLFGSDAGGTRGGRQELAAASAVLRRLAVVAGGPGTGKTTTVARIAALLLEQAAARPGARLPHIALAAPTGKASARLEEAVHAQAADLDVTAGVRDALLALEASTLHRLLGWRPDSHSRFRHHRDNRLPHDVVIVDETSMVSLSLMGRLVEAVRPGARLVLVGDPGQLTSIEAGAVLGDVVGPAADGLRMRPGAREALEGATGVPVAVLGDPAPDVAIGDGIVVLETVHRYGGAIDELARAIRDGDADTALDVLGRGADDVVWLPGDIGGPGIDGMEVVRRAAVKAGRELVGAARDGRPQDAIGALHAFRILCAHRRGPYGAMRWRMMVERWLAEAVDGFDTRAEWYVGRPLLVTENDPSLRLYNGDTGVVFAAGTDRIAVAFERRGDIVEMSPSRLSAVDTVYAMTVHKSQGSQFGTAAVLLPPPDSPLLTRELLYTAATRASDRLIVAGTEAAIRAAIARPAARASALRERLWGASGS